MKTKTIKIKNYLLEKKFTVKLYIGNYIEIRKVYEKVKNDKKKLTAGITIIRNDKIYVLVNEEADNSIRTYIHELTHVVDLIFGDLGFSADKCTDPVFKGRLLKHLVEKTKDILEFNIEKRELGISDALRIYNIPQVKLVQVEKLPEPNKIKKPIMVSSDWISERPSNKETTCLYVKSGKDFLENVVECAYLLILLAFEGKGVEGTEARAYATGYLVTDLINYK